MIFTGCFGNRKCNSDRTHNKGKRTMKRTILTTILVLTLAFCLMACGCEHEWTEATCLTPSVPGD